MKDQDIRRRQAFGKWLKFKRGKVSQSEAVRRMFELHGIKATVETWSRWETGVRLPPEKKIDAVADAVDAARARARRLAGYKAPIKGDQIGPGQTPTSLVQRLLQEVMKHQKPETRMLNLYVMLYVYDNYHKPGWSLKLGRDLELMQGIARVYETLNNFSHEAQRAALTRIKKICELAHKLPLKPAPWYTATLSLPPCHDFPIPLGSKVTITCADDTADEISYEYMVDDIQPSEGGRAIARLLYIAEKRGRVST